MRLAALGALLLAVYAATLSIPATAGEDLTADEAAPAARRPLVGRGRRPRPREPVRGRPVARVHATASWSRPARSCSAACASRRASGCRWRSTPAYALGGARAVELLIAALTALAFVLAAVLARRVVPEPWASGAVLVAGLSPPALAAATTVSPEPVGGGADRRARRCARCGCATAGGCGTPTRARCCSACCRGWTRRWRSPGCPPRSASCAGRCSRAAGWWR